MKRWWGVMVCAEDLGKSVESYERMFGLPAREQWDGCSRFDFEQGGFYVMRAPKASPFLILETDDIHGEVERLRRGGFQAGEPFAVKGGMFSFYENEEGDQFGLIEPSA